MAFGPWNVTDWDNADLWDVYGLNNTLDKLGNPVYGSGGRQMPSWAQGYNLMQKDFLSGDSADPGFTQFGDPFQFWETAQHTKDGFGSVNDWAKLGILDPNTPQGAAQWAKMYDPVKGYSANVSPSQVLTAYHPPKEDFSWMDKVTAGLPVALFAATTGGLGGLAGLGDAGGSAGLNAIYGTGAGGFGSAATDLLASATPTLSGIEAGAGSLGALTGTGGLTPLMDAAAAANGFNSSIGYGLNSSPITSSIGGFTDAINPMVGGASNTALDAGSLQTPATTQLPPTGPPAQPPTWANGTYANPNIQTLANMGVPNEVLQNLPTQLSNYIGNLGPQQLLSVGQQLFGGSGGGGGGNPSGGTTPNTGGGNQLTQPNSNGSFLDNLLNTGASVLPSYLALQYANNLQQPNIGAYSDLFNKAGDTSGLLGTYDLNTGTGRSQLQSSLAARGVLGSSFGDQSLTNYNTQRDLGRGSLGYQGIGTQLNALNGGNTALLAQNKIKTDLLGRALGGAGNALGSSNSNGGISGLASGLASGLSGGLSSIYNGISSFFGGSPTNTGGVDMTGFINNNATANPFSITPTNPSDPFNTGLFNYSPQITDPYNTGLFNFGY